MNKRIGINVFTNLIAMSLSLLINFIVTPILINSLSMGAYSYVGIITNILSFFTVLTYTLNSMVGRFYTYSYNNDKNLSNRYISSALVTCLLLVVFLLPVLILCAYKLDTIIIIEDDLVSDVKFAFFLSSSSFLLGTISSVFSTGAYCKNKLEVSNTVNIIANLFRVALVLLLFRFFNARIWYLGISTIAQNLISIVLGYITFKKLIPEVRFSIKLFNINCASDLLTAGLFNSVILLGLNLMSQIDLLVGNRYICSELIGKYAVVLLFSNTLRSLASALSSAFSPTTINLYSKGDLKGVVKNSNNAVNFCGTILGWPISIIASLGIYFLAIWLNKDFTEFKYMIILMMIPLNMNLALSQLNVVNQAANKLKVPAISTLVCGITNFIFALLLIKTFGLWGIPIASVIAFTFNNLIILPIYTAMITNQKLNVYYKGLMKPIIYNLTTCLVGLILVKHFGCYNLKLFLIECIILTLIYFALVWMLMGKEIKNKILVKFKCKAFKKKNVVRNNQLITKKVRYINMYKITIAGTGYVGLVAGVCFAEVGHKVNCVDIDKEKIYLMKRSICPIYEAGLEELMRKNYAEGRIDYTTDYKTAYRDADAIFIGVGTPEQADGSADLSHIAKVARQIAESVKKDCLVVVKSTVPVGTNDKVEKYIKDFLVNDVKVEVASNPEFLAQGSAVQDTLHASRIIIGTESKWAEEILKKIYEPFNLPIVSVSRRSAEMIKYASNDFLALKISYMNDIANLCELVGADIKDVAKGMSFDKRIGSKFLNAGIGYGGSCFPKDTRALEYLARQNGYELRTIKAAIEVNKDQKTLLYKKACKRLITFDGLKAAVLGLTFKPGTDDLREAPSLETIPLLLEHGADIYAYDPAGADNFKKKFSEGRISNGSIKYVENVEDALSGANICFIFTEWDEIKAIKPEDFKKLMRSPLVYDGRNIYKIEEMYRAGVEYYSVGRPYNKVSDGMQNCFMEEKVEFNILSFK